VINSVRVFILSTFCPKAVEFTTLSKILAADLCKHLQSIS
jgi:hypothetical protein